MGEGAMEQRISKIEQELAIMATTQRSMKTALEDIASTLKELLSLQADTRVMQNRINTIDSETREAFKRVYKQHEKDLTNIDRRLTKIENIMLWAVRSVFAGIVVLASYILQSIL